VEVNDMTTVVEAEAEAEESWFLLVEEEVV